MLHERWPRIMTSVAKGKNWFANSENTMQDALKDMVKILTDAQGTSQEIKVTALQALMQLGDPTLVPHHVVEAVLKFYEPNRIKLQKADGAKEAVCVVIDKMSVEDKAQKVVDIHKMTGEQLRACAREFSVTYASLSVADLKQELAGLFAPRSVRQGPDLWNSYLVNYASFVRL